MTTNNHRLRRARAEHAGAARGRRQPRRARGADGRRPPRLRDADRRRRRVPRAGLGRRRRLRHRLRQRGDPHRPHASRHSRARRSAADIADEIQDVVSFGVGRKNRSDDAPVGSSAVRERRVGRACRANARDELRDKARAQLGTVGSGNHYVDVFADEAGAIWVGVHFGSRGFGHTVASGFLALVAGRAVGRARAGARGAAAARSADGAGLLGADDARGRVRLRRPRVGRAQGRVASSAAASSSSSTTTTTSPGGRSTAARPLVVVRKGATPAFPGQQGFIGGSMGDDAVIVRGATAAGHADRGAAARRAVSRPCTAPAA